MICIELKGSPGDSFGSTIALHNNTLVVGSPGREVMPEHQLQICVFLKLNPDEMSPCGDISQDLWQYTGSTLSSGMLSCYGYYNNVLSASHQHGANFHRGGKRHWCCVHIC